jgi:hypothetical protein
LEIVGLNYRLRAWLLLGDLSLSSLILLMRVHVIAELVFQYPDSHVLVIEVLNQVPLHVILQFLGVDYNENVLDFWGLIFQVLPTESLGLVARIALSVLQ